VRYEVIKELSEFNGLYKNIKFVVEIEGFLGFMLLIYNKYI